MRLKDKNFLQEIFLKNEDAIRCQNALLKLQRHLNEPIILTGSIAAKFHLYRNNQQIKGNLNDIDIVVNDLSVLLPTLSGDFLIRHFHPHREKGKIIIMLVDEENCLRIDVFTPQTIGVMNRLEELSDGPLLYKFISAEDILAKLLGVVYPIVKDEPVEKKYFDHFKMLLEAADLNKAKELWHETRQEDQPLGFEDTVRLIDKQAATHPDLLQVYQYDQNTNQHCSWCINSGLFPLAPLSKIYDILGYV